MHTGKRPFHKCVKISRKLFVRLWRIVRWFMPNRNSQNALNWSPFRMVSREERVTFALTPVPQHKQNTNVYKSNYCATNNIMNTVHMCCYIYWRQVNRVQMSTGFIGRLQALTLPSLFLSPSLCAVTCVGASIAYVPVILTLSVALR